MAEYKYNDMENFDGIKMSKLFWGGEVTNNLN